MKKIILLSGFFIGFFVQAQSGLTLSKSEIFQDEKRFADLLFAENDGQGGLITIRAVFSGFIQSLSAYYIEQFNADLNTVSKTELAAGPDYIRSIKIANDSIYLMTFEQDKVNETFKINLLSSALGKSDFKKRNLLTFDKNNSSYSFWRGTNKLDDDTFGAVIFSENKNYMAVSFDVKQEKKEARMIYVFDNQFKKIGEYPFELDIKDRLFDLESIEINDADGALYLLGKVFENDSRTSKKENKANYHYDLYYLHNDVRKQLTIKTDTIFVRSLKSYMYKGSLSFFGFYSEKNDYRYKGSCKFDINTETFEISHNTFSPFTEQFLTDKYGEVKEKELSNLTFRNIHRLANGDIILNAEEFFVVSVYVNGVVYTTFNYNDIIALKLRPDGTMVWARNINKRQSGINGTESFTSFVHNDNNYLLINASDKIKPLSNNRIQFNHKGTKKANLYAITIAPDGSYTYQEIVDGDKENMPYAVRFGAVTKEGEAILFGRNGKNKQLLKVKAGD